MNNNIGDVLYRKRAAHIGAITAKLSIAAVIFTVIIGAGMVVHQMLAALLLMLWVAVTICFVGLLLLDPVWRSVPGKLRRNDRRRVQRAFNRDRRRDRQHFRREQSVNLKKRISTRTQLFTAAFLFSAGAEKGRNDFTKILQ